MTGNYSVHSRGQGIIEYALIMVLVAVVVVIVLAFVGTQVSQVFLQISSALQPKSAGGGGPPPECYGTLLLPAMLVLTGVCAFLASFFPGKQHPALGKP